MLRKLLTHTRYRLITVLLLIAATNAGVGLLHSWGILMPMEMLAYDYLLGLKVGHAPAEPRILLVQITEGDLKRLGHWPLTDSELALLLDRILPQRPRVVGLDLYRDVAVPPGTERLRQVFSSHANIVTIFKMEDKAGQDAGKGASREAGAASGTDHGFCDLPVDPDAMVRRGLLFMDDGTNTFTSFARLMALHYLAPEGIAPEPAPANPDFMKLGQAIVAPLTPNDGGYVNLDTRGYQLLLDYGRGAFLTTNFTELIEGRATRELIRDKIVIIGVAAESVKDIFFIPVNRSLLSHQTNYGMEVHAHLASQLLRLAKGESAPPSFAGDGPEYLWMLFWGVLAGMTAARVKTLSGFVSSSVVGLGLFFAVTWGLFRFELWLPVMPALLAYLFSGGGIIAFMSFGERSDKKTLMQIFSRHVSRDVAQMIMHHKDKILDGGRPISQKLTASVLFVDIVSFTTVAEQLEPQELMDWLNGYLGAMTAVIIRHQGVINKYIGDAIMAIFGVPFAREREEEIVQDAIHAVDCALEMGRVVEAMNQLIPGRERPRVRVRIGVNTGAMVAGCVGNDQRMEYTVLGDTVNIASRLEGLKLDRGPETEKERDWRLYVGEATWRIAQDRFEGCHVGNLELKGKATRVDVYQVTGTKTTEEGG